MMLLLRWLGRRPLWLLHGLGSGLGWLAWCGSARYRQRMRDNAAAAGVPDTARRAAVPEAGRMITELPRLWLRPPGQALADPVRWDGDVWLAGQLDSGRGLVLLTPHLGSFEVAAQAYAERFGSRWPMTALYRPAENAFVRQLEVSARTRPGLMTAPANVAGVRQLLRALKSGQTVGMLPDQVPAKGMGVWAPFFGKPAYTMTLAARLARQSGAALAVLWCERLSGGRGYVVHAQPLAHPPADDADDVAAATAINQSMEAVIRQCPQQYLWGYFRYKGPSA